MKTKDFTFEVKAAELSTGTFEGYASTFGGAPDSQGDIVRPGAFAETLATHRRLGTMPSMLFGHKSNELPIGNWDEIVEDGKGLRVKGTVDLDDPFAVRVHGKLKRKELRGLSVGFQVPPGGSEPDEKRAGVNFLTNVILWEVSVVNFPSNKRAAVDVVKAAIGAHALPTLPEFEDFLREAGSFSRSQAKAIACHGLGHLLRCEAEGQEQATTPAVLKALSDIRAVVNGLLPS